MAYICVRYGAKLHGRFVLFLYILSQFLKWHFCKVSVWVIPTTINCCLSLPTTSLHSRNYLLNDILLRKLVGVVFAN